MADRQLNPQLRPRRLETAQPAPAPIDQTDTTAAIVIAALITAVVTTAVSEGWGAIKRAW